MGRLAVAPLALLLAACGGGKFEILQAPTTPFGAFSSVVVEPFTIEGLDQLPFEKQSKAQNAAAELTEAVRARLRDRGLLQGTGGKTLVIRGKLSSLDEGSQALRYWVGFGAGKGEVVVDTTYHDEELMIARGAAHGTVSGGWFGGKTRDACKRVAKAVAGFIEDHLKK